MSEKEPWYVRFARNLGLDPYSHKGKEASEGLSKHGRARTKPQGWREKRKARRVMAKASRKINRDRR
jgi:hypothetical protein